MKKYLTLKNLVLVTSVFVVVLMFFLSFAGNYYLNASGEIIKFPGYVWGAQRIDIWYAGSLYESLAIPKGEREVPALPLVGLILALVAAIGMCLVTFLIPDEKFPAKKWIVVACAGLIVVGGILLFVNKNAGRELVCKLLGIPRAELEKHLAAKEGYDRANMCVATGILYILFGGAAAGIQFLKKDIAFVK